MGKLLNSIHKSKPSLTKVAALRQKRLALTSLKLKRAVRASLAAPVVQYKTFSINKSYLISTLPTHT